MDTQRPHKFWILTGLAQDMSLLVVNDKMVTSAPCMETNWTSC